MEKFKHISPETQKSNRVAAVFFAFCGFIIAIVAIGAIFSSEVDFSFSIIFFAILAIASFGISIYLWKDDKELTDEAIALQKEKNDTLLKKWYLRYPLSILYCGIALLGYMAWQQGNYPSSGLILLANPITAVACAILALVTAWELALALIIIVLLYFVYMGIASLPVSVAIVLGACIIAYAIYKRRA